MFSTNIKAYMQPGEFLMLDVRSSGGIKHDLMLANTIGIIDQDFYDNPDNGGNIGICLRNLRPEMKLKGFAEIVVDGETIKIPVIDDLREINTVYVKAGERVAQGIFINSLEADNGNTEQMRKGGIGST